MDCQPPKKSRILTIGLAWRHEPDQFGRTASLTGWHMDQGGEPDMGRYPELVGGWPIDDLIAISDHYHHQHHCWQRCAVKSVVGDIPELDEWYGGPLAIDEEN